MKPHAKRIGVFGGTFDPIHLGHLTVAEVACDELALDRILFVLTPHPPHKSSRRITAVHHRLEMLKLAIKDNPRFEYSTIELDRPGPCYSIDTLRQIKAQPDYVATKLYFVIGMDSLVDFHRWRAPERIMEIAELVVYPRINFLPDGADPRFRDAIHLLTGPLVTVSSTDIRHRVKQNQSIRYLVPEAIRLYITQNSLYRK